MKKITFFILLSAAFSLNLKAQPLQSPKSYDISKDRLLYTVGYAHLDTEWN